MCKKSQSLYTRLKKNLPNGRVKKDVFLKDLTTLRVGGKVTILVEPRDLEEFIKTHQTIVDFGFKYFVLGNGSNILCSDQGYDGVIIRLSNNFSEINKIGNSIIADSGASLGKVIGFAKENSLTGIEDGVGIPATVGGAVFMNASAYNFRISEVVSSVLAMVDGKIKVFDNKECEFSYRSSIFQKLKNAIILRVEFKLKKCKKLLIEERIKEVLQKRQEKQPLGVATCGSVFKNGEDYFAGELIERAGLKGKSIGEVEISNKHANFIVNKGNATSKDIIDLINFIKEKILQTYGKNLETEIRFLGEKNDIW